MDAARARQSPKRGGDRTGLELDAGLTIAEAPNIDLVALDDALTALSAVDQRRARVVEPRFFGASAWKSSPSGSRGPPETVMRIWKVAKAWLFKQLHPETL